MEVYKKVVGRLQLNYKLADGKLPGWVQLIMLVFKMSKNLDKVIDQVEHGEIADITPE